MTSMKTSAPCAAPALAACLGAAQREAERLYGHGPVRSWQPGFDRRPWIAAAVVAAATVAAAVWWWGSAAPQVAAADAPTDRPQRAEPGERIVPPAPPIAAAPAVPAGRSDVPAEAIAAAGCYGAACAPSGLETGAEGTSPAAVVAALPAHLDSWALDPQPIAPQADAPQAALVLFNQPDVPDEHDATPADETLPDDAAFEAPAE